MKTESHNSFQPIVKVVGNYCNLRCDYCFYNHKDQSKKNIMDSGLLEKFTNQFLASYSEKKAKIIWHGGEPLLAGIDFYKNALSIQRNYSHIEVSNCLQTNGVLLNVEWIVFFKENDFGIGISLDGTNASNISRKSSSGKEVFDIVSSNIILCREMGLCTGLIQTITKSNIDRLEDDWEYFYSELGQISWGMNFFSDMSVPSDKKYLGISDSEALNVQERLLEFWLKKNDKDLCIGEIDDFVSGAIGKRPRGCAFNGSCGNYFCLDIDGNIYLCDRTSGNIDSSWGNLYQEDLSCILFRRGGCSNISNVNNLPDSCKNCEWLAACNNGCTALRNNNNEFIYCNARKTMFRNLNRLIVEQQEKQYV